MREISLNFVNEDCDNNPSNEINNINVTRRADLYKNKLYNNNSDFVGNRNDDYRNFLSIFHQNIMGFKGKIDELMIPLHNKAPSLICLTEHHLKDHEINAIHVKKYNLGSTFCIIKLKNGGLCIYIREELKFYAINLHKYCKEQDLEFAIQIKINEVKIIIFSIYRAPSDNFDYFTNKLDHVLNSFLKYNLEFIICGM
jgi:hypothetical protein